MRPSLSLAFASLLLLTIPFAMAAEQTSDQRIGEGIMMILKGEKQKAWDLLLPEAKPATLLRCIT